MQVINFKWYIAQHKGQLHKRCKIVGARTLYHLKRCNIKIWKFSIHDIIFAY